MQWVSICEVGELIEGSGKYIEIEGFQLAVFAHAGGIYAMDNRCPHAGANLSAGHVADGCVVCPWHGWQFHVDTGELRDAPGVCVRTYRTRLLQRDGRDTLIQVELPIY